MPIKVPTKVKQALGSSKKPAQAKKLSKKQQEIEAKIAGTLAIVAGKTESQVIEPSSSTMVPESAGSVVKIVLPFKAESKTYLEVVIDGKTGWLQKSSLIEFSKVNDNEVRVTMTKAQARRRGLMAA